MENLVLFTGLGRNESSYNRFKNSAPSGWNIFTLNSTFLTDIDSPQKTIENISEQMEKLKLKKVSLAGHSLGGSLAVLYSYYYPERIKHLFLFDPVVIHEDRTLFYFIRNFMLSHALYSWKVIAVNLNVMPRIIRKPTQFAKLFRYVRALDFQEEAKSISIPTTIFWAENDRIVPPSHGSQLARLIKGSKLVILKGVGHDWPLYKPELFWENING